MKPSEQSSPTLRHVTEGEKRVARQPALVERIIAKDHDPTPYARILGQLERMLDAMREHLFFQSDRARRCPPDRA